MSASVGLGPPVERHSSVMTAPDLLSALCRLVHDQTIGGCHLQPDLRRSKWRWPSAGSACFSFHPGLMQLLRHTHTQARGKGCKFQHLPEPLLTSSPPLHQRHSHKSKLKAMMKTQTVFFHGRYEWACILALFVWGSKLTHTKTQCSVLTEWYYYGSLLSGPRQRLEASFWHVSQCRTLAQMRLLSHCHVSHLSEMP